MSETAPHRFRPMADLDKEWVEVEMALLGSGVVVIGWLSCCFPTAPRTYWMQDALGRAQMIAPIGWRPVPTAEQAEAWALAVAA